MLFLAGARPPSRKFGRVGDRFRHRNTTSHLAVELLDRDRAMSRKKGYERRLRLFDLGNTQCPICLTRFSRDAVENGQDVTMEHVPPRATGGSEKCLTCTNCNKSAGKSLDQAAAIRNKAIRDMETGRGMKVEIDVFGTKHTSYLSPDGIEKSDLDTRLARNPNVASFLNRMELSGQKTVLLAQMTRGPIWDVSKGIKLSSKEPSGHRIAVSWLRSAYLLVFCLLGPSGYRYAESGAIRPIREQIMNPHLETVPSLLCDVSRLKLPNDLIMINNWQRPYCWIVKIGSLGILLPHGGTAEHYSDVQSSPDKISPKGVIGWFPAKFGASQSFELSLHEDSVHVGRDLFGQEITIAHGDFERKCMVVNQQELLSVFLPSSPVVRRTDR